MGGRISDWAASHLKRCVDGSFKHFHLEASVAEALASGCGDNCDDLFEFDLAWSNS